MVSSFLLVLGIFAGLQVFHSETDQAGKQADNTELAKFLNQNKQEVAALAAVVDYALNGNNPKAVTAKYQELARKYAWHKTIDINEGPYANLGKELNKLPSRLAAVKGNTKEAVIAKQKSLFSNLVAVFAAELQHQDADEGSHDQKKLDAASLFAKIFEAYIKFHSENDRNDNDRVEAN